MQNKYRLIAITVTLLLLVTIVGWAAAQGGTPQAPDEMQGAAFTYQGQLDRSGAPFTGACSFQFSLWDALSGGVRWGSVQTISSLSVNQGRFTALLNQGNEFGALPFNGEARWLEIAVQCPGDAAYTTLSPRQALTGAPFALSLIHGSRILPAGSGFGLHVSNNPVTSGIDNPIAISASVNETDFLPGAVGYENVPVAVRGSAQVGYGVMGISASDAGVFGRGSFGVFGESSSNIGVYGSGGNTGVYSEGGVAGVYGSGGIIGVWGSTDSQNATGVQGRADAAGSVGVWGASAANTGVYGFGGIKGVWGSTPSQNATAVYGEANAAGSIGVWGHSDANTGVYGDSTDGYGVWGASTNSTGVYGRSFDLSAYGVFATSPYVGMWAETTGVFSNRAAVVGDNFNSSTGWAGYFYGNVNATGTVSLAASGFTIDHPLDPASQTLSHSSVESPEMKTLYDGIVVTDSQGQAVVQLPDYFEALNRDFRYQLTVIGQFAQAIVTQEIANNQFTIQTDQPNVKVSWQVTGVRHDPYASWQPLVTESQKPADQVGLYWQPQVYGMPVEMGIGYQTAQPPAEMNIQPGELPQAPQASLPVFMTEQQGAR